MSCCPLAGLGRKRRHGDEFPRGGFRASGRSSLTPGEARADWWQSSAKWRAAWALPRRFRIGAPRRFSPNMPGFQVVRTAARALSDIGAFRQHHCAQGLRRACCRSNGRNVQASRVARMRHFARGGFFTADGKGRFVPIAVAGAGFASRSRVSTHPQYRPHPGSMAYYDPHGENAAPHEPYA